VSGARDRLRKLAQSLGAPVPRRIGIRLRSTTDVRGIDAIVAVACPLPSPLPFYGPLDYPGPIQPTEPPHAE
jgi:hypothetical protein